jgi:hypothetical protein
VVAASTTWTMIAYEPHITRWRPSEQERKKRDKGERHKTRWSSSSMLEYICASEWETNDICPLRMLYLEKMRKRERARASERVGKKERRIFSLFSRRSFAYFSTHTYACNLILHSRSFDDGNHALKWVKIKKRNKCAAQ